MAEYPDDLAHGLAQLTSMLLSDQDVDSVLGKIAYIAVETIGGCDSASVAVLEGDIPRSRATTDGLAAAVDCFQYEIGEGPCLTALAERRAVRVDSMAEEGPRWPQFVARALEQGLASSLSVPLVIDHTLGTLNLYARAPRSFSIEDQRVAALFVAQAAVTLANAQAFADRTRLAEQLRQAIQSRTVVDQAIGVIMARRRIGAEEALQMLRTASNNLNEKLREVAQSLLDSVSSPDDPKA